MEQRCLLCGFVLALLASQLCHQPALAQRTEINYAFMTSGGGGFESSGALPAIELAEEMVRANVTVLAGYNLTHTAPLDTQCNRTTAINQFFQSVPSSEPPVLALLGSGCSVTTEPIAEIVHHWNISQISYASSSITLNERNRFPNFFRTYPSDSSFIPAIRSVIEFYGWRRIMFLTQDENIFTEIFSLLRMQLMPLNIRVESRMLPSPQNSIRLPPASSLFDERRDPRVFFINTYSDVARAIICEAAKLNLTYPRYAWLTYGWYQNRWWSEEVNPNTVDCSDEQLATFLERALALQIFPSPDDPSAPTDTGLSADDFYEMYEDRVRESPFNYTFVSSLAYDATWALAIALDRTSRMVNLPVDMVRDMTGCRMPPGGGGGNAMGSGLVPLENFTYANAFMGCVIRWSLTQTDFEGVSGRVKFDEMGTRMQIRVVLQQYQNNDVPGNITRVNFGFIDSMNGSQFSYINNETNMTIYPDGIPPDGTPINITVTFNLALVITYDIIAFLGLIFTTVCLVFNFAFRNRKIVRLTSPNLNYFIILGCYIIYISVFFRLVPTIDPNFIKAQCHLQSWLSTVGYTLAFATILAKMIRVHYIFNNPTAKKQSLKDWHLIIIILSITSFSVLLLIIGSAVPQLRPVPTLATHNENPTGENELGVRIDFFSWRCYSSNVFFWLIVIFVYLILLQIVGFILAVQTRKVKIKALNDSKYVAAIIYVTSIVLVILLVTFALSQYLNITEIFFNGSLMVGTTAFLGLIFIPKMVSLYQDPHGEKVFSKTHPSSTIEISKSGAIALRSKSAESDKILQLESKIKDLENERTINDRRNTVATVDHVGQTAIVANGNSKPRSASACDVRIELHPVTPSQFPAKPPDTHLESKEPLSLNSNLSNPTEVKDGLKSSTASYTESSPPRIAEGDVQREITRAGSTAPLITPISTPSPSSQRRLNGGIIQSDL